MKKIILDFDNVTSVREAHDYIASKMNFPDYYGKNLDALYDSLTEIGNEVYVKIINCDLLDEVENSIVNVFWDAEIENDMLYVEVERKRTGNEDRTS